MRGPDLAELRIEADAADPDPDGTLAREPEEEWAVGIDSTSWPTTGPAR